MGAALDGHGGASRQAPGELGRLGALEIANNLTVRGAVSIGGGVHIAGDDTQPGPTVVSTDTDLCLRLSETKSLTIEHANAVAVDAKDLSVFASSILLSARETKCVGQVTAKQLRVTEDLCIPLGDYSQADLLSKPDGFIGYCTSTDQVYLKTPRGVATIALCYSTN